MNRSYLAPKDAVALLLITVPFLLYCWTVWQYSVNVPFWDDFSVILKPVTAAFTADSLREKILILLAPSNGHLPFLTRLVAVAQVEFFGAINFHYSIFAANIGWLLTVLLLLCYARQQWRLSWFALLPVPLVLFTITHWEVLDFTTPAWQMYWGSALLPLVCLIAAVHRRWLLSAISFSVALFFSSGALALLPLVIAYGVYRRYWRDTVFFALISVFVTAFFLYFNPPKTAVLPSLLVVLKFIPAFMGNITSNGRWDLHNIQWIHFATGISVILSGCYVLRRLHNVDLAKLLFIYVLILACMAVYLRGGINPDMAPRYSLFALLAVASLYCAFAQQWQSVRVDCIAGCIAVAAALWLHSYYSCLNLLAYDHNVRPHFLQQYLLGGDLDKLLWDPAYGREALEESTAAGTYNPEVMNMFQLPVRAKK